MGCAKREKEYLCFPEWSFFFKLSQCSLEKIDHPKEAVGGDRAHGIVKIPPETISSRFTYLSTHSLERQISYHLGHRGRSNHEGMQKFPLYNDHWDHLIPRPVNTNHDGDVSPVF